MLKTGKFRNSFQRKIGFGEQLFDAVDLDPADFRLRRALEVLTKSPL